MTAAWSEGVLVGYRWNEAKKKPSAFPFGFGLAYTTFTYSEFQADCAEEGKATISFQVANTGLREGSAVPQLYIGFASLRPMQRQLRGFRKVRLAPGAREKVVFELDGRDWSVWSEAKRAWASAHVSEVVTAHVSTSSAAVDDEWSQNLTCLSGQVALAQAMASLR